MADGGDNDDASGADGLHTFFADGTPVLGCAEDVELADAIAIDCEMVLCNKTSCLAHVCAVAVANEEVLLNSYCAPPSPVTTQRLESWKHPCLSLILRSPSHGQVTDYLTRYSGVRAKDLEGAPPFQQIKDAVAALCKGRILVGHGLHNDLRALQLVHPPSLQLDTLIDCDWGSGRRKGLASLSLELLGEPIQRHVHSPREDAIATLRLLKLWRRHRGPPPPRRVSLRLAAAVIPEPPGCDVVSVAEAAEAEVEGTHGVSTEVTADTEWIVSFEWSGDTVVRLLRWWASQTAALPSARSGGLRFAPSLPKEHRGVLHREAKREKLETCSRGLGEARAVRVLPPGERVPSPPVHVRAVAAAVVRVARRAFEDTGEGELIYSVGEMEEIVQAYLENGSSPPPDVATLIACVHCALPTLPTGQGGDAHGRSIRWAYERVLCVQGRSSSDVFAFDPGGAKGGGRGHGRGAGGRRRGGDK